MTQLNDICPVCGMTTNAKIPLVKYYDMYFHFCSLQCQKMFNTHPSLYDNKTKKEPREIIKRRTIRLDEALSTEAGDLLNPYLMKMMGMKKVNVEGEKIEITYDLLQVTETQVEKMLMAFGVQLGAGWLVRLQRGWIHESEEIELDNLSTPSARSYNWTPPT